MPSEQTPEANTRRRLAELKIRKVGLLLERVGPELAEALELVDGDEWAVRKLRESRRALVTVKVAAGRALAGPAIPAAVPDCPPSAWSD